RKKTVPDPVAMMAAVRLPPYGWARMGVSRWKGSVVVQQPTGVAAGPSAGGDGGGVGGDGTSDASARPAPDRHHSGAATRIHCSVCSEAPGGCYPSGQR